METLLKDIRYGVRSLLRHPGFTAIAIITLALGIGANTAIFSVVNALLFKPLPYPQAERLMAVAFDNDQPQGYQHWPYPKYAALRDEQASFESVAAYSQTQMTVTVSEQPEKAEAEIVTASYFPLLGVKPELGRVFLTEEDQTPDTHAVVLLGHQIWQQQFGGDSQVLGKTIYIKQQPFTVVGVMPADFRGQSGTTELWVPMMMAGRLMYKSVLTSQAHWWLKVIARLKPGVTQARASAEMPIVSAKVAQLVPAQTKSMLSKSGAELIMVVPLKETKIDPSVRRSFLILLAVVGLALLITCANTANLLLARALSRQKEFAVRMAVGASRGRLLRLVLIESVLLALLGGGAGLLVAMWGIEWLTTAKPWNTVGFWSQYAQTFDFFAVKLDWSILAFNFLLAFLVGIFFGLVPAWRASRPQIVELLKQEGASSVAGLRSLRRPGMRSVLVVTEIALSLVLLTGAGLMVRSFARLSAVKLGFEPNGVVTMTLDAERQSIDFYKNLVERLRALPGVEQASLSLAVPLSGNHSGGGVHIEGRPEGDSGKNRADFNIVSPEYFDTLRIAILRGRCFTAEDRIGAPRVAVVSHSMAERYWPGEDPIGKRIKTPFRDAYGEKNAWIAIVGVVDDVKYGAVEEGADPVLYLPAWQPLGTPQALSLAPEAISIRATSDPASLIPSVRREIQSLDKSVPIYDVSTMNERATKLLSRYRYSALLVGMFAGVAVLLSAMGIYGIVTYTVSARTRELGIRIALGAQRNEILRLVMADGVVLVLAGLCLGLLGAFAATRVLASQLYEVRSGDPATFLVVALVMVVVALTACYIPARRATKVDPLVALRYE